MQHVSELSLNAYTSGDEATRQAFADELMRGFQDLGFIILTDHGISTELIARAYKTAERVFALPEETKRRYTSHRVGYTPFGIEHAKGRRHPDLKEFWSVGHEPMADAPDEGYPENVWPVEVPGFRDAYIELFAALNQTGIVLLRALAPKLGLDEQYFDALVTRGSSTLRVLHYPPLAPDVDPNAVRSAAHEDINFLTIMVAAKGPGLELLDRNGTWLPVVTDPTNLIVDTGDMLARMTNFVLPATTHRVVNPAGPNVDRYSIPFFMHPTPQTSLKALPSCIGDGEKMPAITAGEYHHERLREIGLTA
jgi:isopenicillin N synthase-like dioxygenase